MKKYYILPAMLCLCAVLAGCSDQGNGTPSETSSKIEVRRDEVQETDAVPFSETAGVWTYGSDIIFHASDGKRYALKEDPAGTVQDQDGKSYVLLDCNYRLISILNLTDTELNVKEARYSEAYLNHPDYPDGYKRMIITYDKSDLFDLSALEEAVKNGTAPAESETVPETAEALTEAESETVPETAEALTEAESETVPETTGAESAAEPDASAEYAAIYQKIEDFIQTDNYQQKDPGNRSLEVFNYLHNLADANIEQDSITNDTAKNEVSFTCYEKYMIHIDNAEGKITVTEK